MNLNATIFGQTISFILFVLFCMKYVWPILMTTIEKRQKEIADSLISVEHAKKECHLAQIEATTHLKLARIESQKIIAQANRRKAQIISETKAEAEEERRKIIAQAQVEIDVERRRVYEELRKQVAIIAVASAEKIIDHSLNETINSNIVDKIIAEL